MAPSAKHVALLIHDIPERVLDAAVDEARTRDTSLNDVIVGTVAAYLDFPYVSTRGKFRYVGTGSKRILRMPRALRERLRYRATEQLVTMRGLVILALSEHFELEPESPKRRKRVA